MKRAASSGLLPTLALPAILLLAAAVRAALTWQHYHHPLFQFLRLDEVEYDGYARDLLEAGWLLPYIPIHAPGYVYALALLYQLFSFNLLAPRLFHLALGLASTVVIYLLARRLFSATAALASAFLFALYWPLLIFEQRILAAPLYLFLYMTAFWITLRAAGRNSLLSWAAAGVVVGLAALVYPPALPWAAAAGAWGAADVLRSGRRRLGLAALALPGAAAAVILPAIIYYHHLSGEWFLLQRNAGLNFYVGNNPDSDGSPYARPGSTWDAVMVMPREAGIEKGSEEDRFYWRAVGDFVRSEPGAFLLLLGRKVLMVVNRFEGRSTLDPGFHRRLFSALALPLPGFSIIMFFALPGLLSLRLRRRDHQLLILFLAVNAALLIATVVASRYRLVFTAGLILLAGAGFKVSSETVVSVLQRKHHAEAGWWQPGVKPGILALIGLLLSFLPIQPRYTLAEELAYLGDAYLSVGEKAKAAESYRRALAEEPDNPLALIGLAWIAALNGDAATAEELLVRAKEKNPKAAQVRLRLGGFYRRQGRLEEAAAAMEEAVKLRPEWVHGLYALAAVQVEAGNLERAREVLNTIARLRPDIDPEKELKELVEKLTRRRQGEKP